MRRRPIPLRPRYLLILPPRLLDALMSWSFDSSCLCGGSFSLPLWGVVGRFEGGFCCGWCIGCWLFVVGRCAASGGVWWRFVWRVVGRLGCCRLVGRFVGRLGCRRFVWRVVGRGVSVFSCRRAGRGAARVSPCVSCRVAGSEACWLFRVEVRGAGPVFSVSVFSPPAPGKGCRVVSAGGGRFLF